MVCDFLCVPMHENTDSQDSLTLCILRLWETPSVKDGRARSTERISVFERE